MPRRFTRRNFVQASATAAVAPYFIPASALGKDGRVAPSERITIAHIGVGGQGTYHLSFNSKHKDVQIVAICDVDSRHLNRAANIVNKQYGSSNDFTLHEDFRELIDRKDIDAALIATPDHWHALTTIAMLKSGKDVYCEKPLTRTIEEGRAVAETAQRYGRVVQTGSHERSNPNARYVADLIRNGYLGDIEKVEVSLPVTNHKAVAKHPATPVPSELNYDMWLGPAPEKYYFESNNEHFLYKGKMYARAHFFFRYQLDYATGEMSDRGAHVLDLVQMSLNRDESGPVEVIGTGKRDTEGEYDSFMEYDFTIKYDDGIEVHGTSKGNDASRGITYHGSEGWINVHVHGCALKASNPDLLKIKLKPSDETIGGHGATAMEHHQNFYNAIRDRGDTVANAETGHRSATVCHIANTAMLLDRPLKWDSVRERYIGDSGANEQLGRTYRDPWTL